MLRDPGKRLCWPKVKLTNWCCWVEYLGESVVGGLKIRDRFPVQLRPTPQVGSTQVLWHPTESQKSILSVEGVPWKAGAKVGHKDHTTQHISHERFIGNCIQRLPLRGGAGERDRNRKLETERQTEWDRQTGNMKAGRDGRDLLKGMYVAFGSWWWCGCWLWVVEGRLGLTIIAIEK